MGHAVMAAPRATFETSRLVLRPPRLADAEVIFREYAQDPEVTRFLTWRPHARIETLEAFLHEAVAAPAHGAHWFWAITLAGDDQPIGMMDATREAHRVMVGYTLGRRYWGNGYVVEAMSPVVEWALSQHDVHRVWAFCDVENRRSARVLEKLGMQLEGTLRRWVMHPNVSEVPRDCEVYARVKG